MRNRPGLRLIEVIVIIVCVLVLLLVLHQLPARQRDEALKVRCLNTLTCMAKGMYMYLNIRGDQSMYAIPAQTFRGDCWLVTLYWTDLIKEPRVFLCPATDDRGTPPEGANGRPPRGLDLGDKNAVAADACSYAGLCKGTSFTSRNTGLFTEAAISSACLMICDDNEDTQNHSDGMCVVYFDSHAEFRPGTKAQTYDLIGAKGGPYEYLDSGE